MFKKAFGVAAGFTAIALVLSTGIVLGAYTVLEGTEQEQEEWREKIHGDLPKAIARNTFGSNVIK